MTVARLEAEMPNREYVGWRVYLGRKAQRQELEQAQAKAKAGKG